MKRWPVSAALPVVMSSLALALVLVHAARHGVIHEADEGTAAHLFQLLMGAQVPLVIFFAAKWLPGDLRLGVRVLLVQAATAIAAFAAVYFLT